MPAFNRPIRRRSRFMTTLAALGVLLAVVAGIFATLWAMGIELPWQTVMAKQELRVPVPINAVPIPPYAQVTRDQMIDHKAGTLAFLNLHPSQVIGLAIVGRDEHGHAQSGSVKAVEERDGRAVFVLRDDSVLPLERTTSLGGALMNHAEIIGRVVANEKSPGFGFTEKSFLPKGAKPGIAAGVPQGMVAMVLDAAKLAGVQLLHQGDKVDLVAAVPVAQLPYFDGLLNDRAASASRPASDKNASEARVIANEAVVVRAVAPRKQPGGSSPSAARSAKSGPVDEVVLAVEEHDVPYVAEAVALELDLNCVVRRPTDNANQSPAKNDAAGDENISQVPVLTRSVAAYQPLTAADFRDMRTRKTRSIPISKADAARRGAVASVALAIGRVVSRDFAPGEIVAEESLLPAGAKPGLTAAIPSGKLALSLDAARLAGTDGLKPGDRFDLLASTPFDLEQRFGPDVVAFSPAGSIEHNAEVRVIVRNGFVLTSPAKPNAKATAAGKTAGRPFAVAVDAEEASRISEVLAAKNSALSVAVRAATANAATAAEPADIAPLDKATTIETFRGGKRQTLVFFDSHKQTSAKERTPSHQPASAATLPSAQLP